MTHYASNICLALKFSRCVVLKVLYGLNAYVRKRVKYLQNSASSNQVIYTLDTICEPNIMTLAQAVLQIFCSQGPLWVTCLGLKREINQSNFDRILWKANQVIYIMYPKLYAWYHDPSSSGSPDILCTRLLYYTKRQSRKRDIIQSNIYRILSNVNQIIYTLDTICMPNIMTLAQAVIQILCWQGP